MKKKILFVDDEPNVLQGLRRMLRVMRHVWDMAFVENGRDALAALAEGPYDVIVTDMRMPGMDGLALLTEVKRRYPNIVRLVLSGHSDQEAIIKTVAVAHQYLAKPCDPATLKDVILHACQLRAYMEDGAVMELVSQIEKLPSIPSLYQALMTEMASNSASAQDIGRIISSDVAMCAKVLQLVNSAFFGIRRRIADPIEAVSYLGFETIKALVLSINIFDDYGDDDLLGQPLEVFVSHSIRVGNMARHIAERQTREKYVIDNSFLAGILHDVGKLVLAKHFSRHYAAVNELIWKKGMVITDAERMVLKVTHAEVGAYLMGLWGLPDPVVGALAFHHTPRSQPDQRPLPLTFVHIADAVDRRGTPSETVHDRMDVDYLAGIGLECDAGYWKSELENVAHTEESYGKKDIVR